MSALERVQGAIAGLKAEVVSARDATPCFEVASSDVHEICRRLRDGAGFETNTFVTAIDRFPKEPRFEVCWQFLSLAHNDRVRVIARLASEAARVETITDLYPGAAYSERECYDMFGITFEGHANLRRLLMPDDYGHFPLRKDFPHQGIEPDRLYREWDTRRHERAAARAQETADARTNAGPSSGTAERSSGVPERSGGMNGERARDVAGQRPSAANDARPSAAANARSSDAANLRSIDASNERPSDAASLHAGDAASLHATDAASLHATDAAKLHASDAGDGRSSDARVPRPEDAARPRDVSGKDVR